MPHQPQAASMGLHRANKSMPDKNLSPPSSQFVVPDDLLAGLSMSKAAVTKSRNRAMTATDFENILCQL